MVLVNTVNGKIDSKELGCTLVHEHLVLRSEAVMIQFPHIYDEEDIYRRAIESANAVKERGIKTICDPTVMGIGRDVRFMEKVANATGIQVVCATGVYSFNEIPIHFQNRDIDYMAGVFIRDIEKGIQNTSIKAGFLKCAADAQGVTKDIEKVFRAVSRAQRATGVPIMTHSYPASKNGLKQLEIFKEEGVNPKSIMIGHTGDTENLEYIHQVLEDEVFIGMDRYGQGPLKFAERNKTLLELLNQGFADRMFISQDYCCSIDWFEEDHPHFKEFPNWSMTYLLDDVISQLKQEGVAENEINQMLVDNVSRWFEGAAEK